MHAADLPAAPDLAIPLIPVICDKCRAGGMAGDAAFSAIPDILNFRPVQRRAHVNGWSEAHQRAFIAALAITGSPRQAARAVGKHAFGAEQLRAHRTGKEFALAWDAAMELARECETHRIHDNLADLARQREADIDGMAPAPAGGSRDDRPDPPGFDPEHDDDDRREYLDAQAHIRERMLRARRLLLMCLAEDPARRAAWETLCGPVDWAKAAAGEAEDGEAYAMRMATKADVMIAAEAGLLPHMTGGRDGVAELFEEAKRLIGSESTRAKTNDDE